MHAGIDPQATCPGWPHAEQVAVAPAATQMLPALQVLPQQGCPAVPHAEQTPATHQSPVFSHWLPGQHGSHVFPQAAPPSKELPMQPPTEPLLEASIAPSLDPLDASLASPLELPPDALPDPDPLLLPLLLFEVLDPSLALPELAPLPLLWDVASMVAPKGPSARLASVASPTALASALLASATPPASAPFWATT